MCGRGAGGIVCALSTGTSFLPSPAPQRNATSATRPAGAQVLGTTRPSGSPMSTATAAPTYAVVGRRRRVCAQHRVKLHAGRGPLVGRGLQRRGRLGRRSAVLRHDPVSVTCSLVSQGSPTIRDCVVAWRVLLSISRALHRKIISTGDIVVCARCDKLCDTLKSERR